MFQGGIADGNQRTTQGTDRGREVGRTPCRALRHRPAGTGPAAGAVLRGAGAVRAVFWPGAGGAGVLGPGACGAGRQPHRPPAWLRAGGSGHAGSGGGSGPEHGRLCAGQVPRVQQAGCDRPGHGRAAGRGEHPLGQPHPGHRGGLPGKGLRCGRLRCLHGQRCAAGLGTVQLSSL